MSDNFIIPREKNSLSQHWQNIQISSVEKSPEAVKSHFYTKTSSSIFFFFFLPCQMAMLQLKKKKIAHYSTCPARGRHPVIASLLLSVRLCWIAGPRTFRLPCHLRKNIEPTNKENAESALSNIFAQNTKLWGCSEMWPDYCWPQRCLVHTVPWVDQSPHSNAKSPTLSAGLESKTPQASVSFCFNSKQRPLSPRKATALGENKTNKQ